MGMFTGGLSLAKKNSMTNSVREGARLGATLQDNSSWAGAVKGRVQAIAGGDLQSGDICAKLIYKNADGTETVKQTTGCSLNATDYPEPASTDIPALTCAVKVWAGRSSSLQAIFFTMPLKLKASAVSFFERTCAP